MPTSHPAYKKIPTLEFINQHADDFSMVGSSQAKGKGQRFSLASPLNRAEIIHEHVGIYLELRTDMKLAKYLWTIASFYLLVIGFFYMVVLKDAPPNGPERYEFIMNNWTTYDYQWKAELMMTTLLSISSFLFSKYLKNPGFIIIGVGQLFFAMAMPMSIGITPNATYEFGSLIGKGAHQMVNFGMMVSLAGYLILHWKSRVLSKGLKVAALILATLAFLSFAAGFINIIESTTAQKAMLLVMLLYLINGYFGIKINETNANNV